MKLEKLLRLLAKTVPLSILPDGQVLINSLRRQANRNEREDMFVRSVSFAIKKSLDKYSPFRRARAAIANARTARKRNDLNCVVGKIALAHARIEQDLKDVIISDWNVSVSYKKDQLILSVIKGKKFTPQPGTEKQVSELFGERLRKFFFTVLREMRAPEHFVKHYEQLYEAFHLVSQRRNEALKSVYALNESTQLVYRVKNWELRNVGNSDLSFEDVTSKWMKSVDIQELEEIASSLEQLCQEFIKLRNEIWHDKTKVISSKVGDTFPSFSSQNPYLYRYLLNNKN